MRYAVLTLMLMAGALGVAAPHAQDTAAPAAAVVLRPTNHPPVPAALSDLWMVPSRRVVRTAEINQLLAAVRLEVDGKFTRALPTLSRSGLLRGSPLRGYVDYYKGLAQLGAGQASAAQATFRALTASMPVGYLAEGAALGEAEADEVLQDYTAAVAIYQRLGRAATTAPEDVLVRLGRAARAAGDTSTALQAFSRVYYEFPLSDSAAVAGAALEQLPNREPIAAGTERFRQELDRAERLFKARRYVDARTAFDALRGAAQGDDRERVGLRIAECDFFLKRARRARDEIRPWIDTASRRGEALFFYALALQDLGQRGEYLQTIHRVIDEFPNNSWAEEALNNLATRYIIDNDDASADDTFRELYARFPRGRYAERAAWKIGWTAFRNGSYAETVRYFESAAAAFPRSDYRPPWLYWAGRAHEALGETSLAEARYVLTATDYLNSYYGRLAVERLNGRAPERPSAATESGRDDGRPSGGADPGSTPLPPNQGLVRQLLGLGLYDQAIDELHYAQKVWGNSPAIEATLAWTFRQQGEQETGERQFALYRAAINTMKRAYPQFIAAGGEGLPPALLKVIFPLGYWDLIRKYSAARDLDPYLVAALTAQESTFVPNIRSYAKAVGLMQLEPSTARRIARKLRIRYTPRLLTNPEMNIRLGTAVLADAIHDFGDVHLVLATYNAGPSAVRRWAAERAGLPSDEFIDDIPYPQTQNYVKKILGMADDYRRLYPMDDATPEADAADPAPAAAPTGTTETRKTPQKKRRVEARKKHV